VVVCTRDISGSTSTETETAHSLIKGTVLDLSDRADNAKNVRAEVLRDLLLGRCRTA
jgi:hypothetical protein